MERISVQSSDIREIGYDESLLILEIVFKEGSIYQYLDVPGVIYEEFIQSSSKGKYFHAHVKNKYRFIKL